MRILIAGCNGLLGQNLLRAAAGSGHEIVGAARAADPALPGLMSGYHPLDLDSRTSWNEVWGAARADFIVNAAAFTDVDGCERDPARCDRVNRDAVGWMAETGAPVAQISTDYVFDGVSGPYSENDPVDPLNHYGRSKLESEALALSRSKASLVLRTMWLWGSETDGRQSFPEFVRASLAAGKSVDIVTDQFGNPTSARDLAEAVWALIAAGRSGLYHAAGSDWMSRHEWALRIAAFHGLDAARVRPSDSAGLRRDAARPLRSGLRCDKLRRDTGLIPGGLDAQLRAQSAS